LAGDYKIQNNSGTPALRVKTTGAGFPGQKNGGPTHPIDIRELVETNMAFLSYSGDMRRLQVLALGLALVGGHSAAQTSAPEPPSSGSSTAATAEPTVPAVSSTAENLSNQQIKDLIRRVAENDIQNDKKLRDYTYTEREETRKLNKQGQVTSTESKTSDVLQIYGETVEKVVAKNDQPLSEKDAAKEEARIQKIIDKRRNESDSDREKRIKKEEKDREEGREFVKEIADAYNFRLLGTETIDGRDAWVIDAEPRPDYVPHRKEAKALAKIAGKVWIDKQESQWVRIDTRVTETISLGLFLARLHEGTRVLVEQTRVNDEVWLPKHAALHVDVRVALLKNFDQDIDVTDRDYKKFHTGVRIVGMQGVVEEKPVVKEKAVVEKDAKDPR
jgi:hypothetical protein